MKVKAKMILPLLSVLFAAVFSVVFLYCNNSEEVSFSEVLPVLGSYILVGIVLFLIVCLLVRNVYKASVIAVLALLVLLNYSQLETGIRFFVPYAKYWHIMPTVVFMLVLFGCLISAYLSDELSKTISDITCLVFAVLVFMNVVISIPGTINRMQAGKELKLQATVVDENTVGAVKQPNIYWFLFDEYANFRQMEEYYDYNNDILKNYLVQNNFNISYNSRNESIITATIATNIVNLDYLVDNSTDSSEKTLLRKQGAMFNILRQEGYTLRGLDPENFFGLPSAMGIENQIEKATTVNGQDISDLCVAQTILYPFHGLDTSEEMQGIMDVVQFMSIPENLERSNSFTLIYLSFPHTPFLVDENGKALRSEFYDNWEDDRYYLGQYKYATTIMIQMINNILDNDPDSVIILQSDHGARAHGMDFFMTKFPLEIMQNPLNAVYFRGQKMDIEGLSSVNTMRFILNELFSMDYEMLPVPEDIFQYK